MTVAGAVTQAERSRGREYTEKQRKFLEEYAKNDFRDARKCLVAAGYSAKNTSVALTSLKPDIQEIAQSLLLEAAPSAARSLVSIIESDKPLPASDHKIKAAKEILDRAGIVKPERVQHEHNVSGGLFILPAKQEVAIPSEVIDV